MNIFITDTSTTNTIPTATTHHPITESPFLRKDNIKVRVYQNHYRNRFKVILDPIKDKTTSRSLQLSVTAYESKKKHI